MRSSSATACSFVVRPPRERPIALPAPGLNRGRSCSSVIRSRPDGPSRLSCRARGAAVSLAHVDRAAPSSRRAATQRIPAPGRPLRFIAARACRPCARGRSIRARRASYCTPWSRTANPPVPVARAACSSRAESASAARSARYASVSCIIPLNRPPDHLSTLIGDPRSPFG